MADKVDLQGELLEPLSEWQADAQKALRQQLQKLRQDIGFYRLEREQLTLNPILRYISALKRFVEKRPHAKEALWDEGDGDDSPLEGLK
jgi:uncharacterized protein YihD (DUF1040 family)